MLKKTGLSIAFVLYTGFVILSAQSTGNNVVDVILKGYSAKQFTTAPVTDNDLDLVLKCGMKAPSGMNSQPWKFTVVKDQALVGQILPNITAGNVLIIVSGIEKQDGTVDNFACALATENMYVAVQGLGMGAHIYAGPVGKINSDWKESLGIPAGYKAVTVLRIGNIDKSIDAVSGASVRKKPEDVINYK